MPGKKSKTIKHATLPVRILLWVGGGILAVIFILFGVLFFIDEPARRYMEEGINRALDGYSATLREVDLNPLLISVTLRGLVLTQDAHPDPPVALFPEFEMSLHWREILFGHLVADSRIERPEIYINLQQLKKENEDEVPVEKRGWQAALKHIFPLELNEIKINDGRLTYIDEDPERPLQLSRIRFKATNIRNIHSPEHTYPSPFRLEANIFERGQGVVEGNADFLAEPYPGLKAAFSLRDVPLEKLHPVAVRANLTVAGGILGGRGELEFAPAVKNFHLADLNVEGLKIDYVHTAGTAEAEKERAKKVKRAAKKAEEEETSFLLDRLRLAGEVGMVNKASDPDYRVYLRDAELVLTQFSDRFRRGPAEATLKGLFMGNGATGAKAVFRPEEKGADLDLRLRIVGTRVTSMNDLLRAHGKFDVVSGSFSLFSEVSVRGKKMDGYVKPFFKDLDVYDPAQEKENGLLQKVYEGVVGGVGQVLENPAEAVATKADISGTLENPDASTWQIVVQLIRNGFFKGILPGFEAQASGRKE